MKKIIIWILIPVVLLSALGAAGYWYYRRSTRFPGFNTEEVDKGEVRQTISATGSLAALTTVEVGCQISGILASISADFNDLVTAGQLIAQIDPSTYEAQVQQAMANLENAHASERNLTAQVTNLQGNLLSVKADAQVQKANIRKAEVALEEAARNLKRNEDLYARKLISASDRDSIKAAADSAEASLQAAKAQCDSSLAKEKSVLAQIESAKAQLEGSAAQIRQMEALLNVSKINLSRTRIYSPIDGVVISRAVDVGQTVAASLQAPTLFTIANDLRKMQINTSVDEADIGKVLLGQVVNFSVDAYRDRTFKGKVGQVRLLPTTTQNVVTYSVMVNVDNDDLSLKPGMTANVEILVDQRENVIRIPTKALFFKPSKELLARLPSPPEPASASKSTRIWTVKRPSDLTSFRPIEVKTGLSNTSTVEILDPKIEIGTLVVIGERKLGDKSDVSDASRAGRRATRSLTHAH